MSEFLAPQSRNEAILQNICGAENELPAPAGRIEKILQAILYEDETIVDFEPESRAELLLYAIMTHGEYDAEPQSRNETILKAILDDDAVEYTFEPQSRIEALLIEWLDKSKYVEKTVSGPVVSVSDAIEAPVQSLTAAVVPVQSGSGDPSPENIRPISGWTGANVYRSGADTSDPTIYPVSFSSAGTVYGGTLNATTGVLTVTHYSIDLGTRNWSYRTDVGYAGFTTTITSDSSVYRAKNEWVGLCSSYPYVGKYNVVQDMQCGYIFNNYVYIKDSRYGTDAAAFETAMSGVQLVYEIATPITYHLTPVEIRTLLGENNIWADTGSVTVTYKARRTAAAMMMMLGRA